MLNAPKGTFQDEYLSVKQGIRYKASGEFREPRKGEFFLSGAIICAYKAPNDISQKYWIAIPVKMKKCACCAGTGTVEEI